MSETRDPLEAELAALRPLEVSPGLRHRVAERLANPPRVGRRRPWRLALAAGLAAAGLTMFLYPRGDDPRADRAPVVVRPPAPHVPISGRGPTLLAYRRALDRSPEALLALLEEDAVTAPEPHPGLVRIDAFPRSDAAIHDLLGDD